MFRSLHDICVFCKWPEAPSGVTNTADHGEHVADIFAAGASLSLQ